jgi:transcription elongation factor Elf1
MDSEFTCAFCGETNSVFIDPAGGAVQRYVEDCQVCCQPNVLNIAWCNQTGHYTIDAESE